MIPYILISCAVLIVIGIMFYDWYIDSAYIQNRIQQRLEDVLREEFKRNKTKVISNRFHLIDNGSLLSMQKLSNDSALNDIGQQLSNFKQPFLECCNLFDKSDRKLIIKP